MIDEVLANIHTLEESGHPHVSANDKYALLLRDIGIEVANRKQTRDSQRREISRMQAALKSLRTHQKYIDDQIEEFDNYLFICRENASKRAHTAHKPIKFAYKDLEKKNVIVDSEVPKNAQGKCKFFISMKEAGKFEVECKVAGFTAGAMHIDLEDLLERRDNGEKNIEEKGVTMHIPSTIHFLNKYFLS